MKLITWNVQWCRGVDGKVDPARIVSHAKAIADFDVLCLQEVANNYPDPRLGGSRGENQFDEFARLLPGYVAVAGVAVDVPADDGGRRHFGNMILSRLPVGQVFRHLLPYPVEAGINGMPRIALEAVVSAKRGAVRIITTHLEYYGTSKRDAQIDALRQIYAEGSGHARHGGIVDKSGGPFHTLPRPASTVITGDFNLEPDDPLHARMGEPFDDGTPLLHDAWQAAAPDEPHPSTFKIYAKEHPGEPELHCDFIFVSADLVRRIRHVRIDQETQASDHQPVLLELD
ncbi:MAG: endonuclease/exonuclease/phosphatase family protein [Pseudomonadota bacterium]|nr:endonuclease/exonuclease/phosphatase family protein [Pseudomonadota bacterium]